MLQTGEFSLHIVGRFGNVPLSRSNFDISQLKELLGYVEDLVYSDKKSDRPMVTFEQRDGSVLNIFHTSKQKAAQIAVILTLLAPSYSLDVLEAKTAKTIEAIQHFAAKYDYDIELGTSESDVKVALNKNTVFQRSEDLWVDAETYFYGVLVDAGGKGTSNIHLDLGNGRGVLKIDADKSFLKGLQENPLYKKYGARVMTKQNVATGEMDFDSLRLLELIGFEPYFDEDYIEGLIRVSTPVWKGVDADNFVHLLREGEYAGKE